MRNEEEEFSEFIDSIIAQMRAHFGDAVKAYWVHAEPLCPGCMVQPIDAITYKGKRAMSINAFMYRERGVMIAYFLCSDCANTVIAAKNGPTELHKSIEENLKNAYNRYLASQDA